MQRGTICLLIYFINKQRSLLTLKPCRFLAQPGDDFAIPRLFPSEHLLKCFAGISIPVSHETFEAMSGGL